MLGFGSFHTNSRGGKPEQWPQGIYKQWSQTITSLQAGKTKPYDEGRSNNIHSTQRFYQWRTMTEERKGVFKWP